MADGPYRVSIVGRDGDVVMHQIKGPTRCDYMIWPEEFERTASDVCHELNMAARVARQEALEQAIEVVARRGWEISATVTRKRLNERGEWVADGVHLDNVLALKNLKAELRALLIGDTKEPTDGPAS